MNNNNKFSDFLWSLLVEMIIEKFIFNFLLKTKVGRWFLLFLFTSFLPLFIPYFLDYVFEPKDSEISRQEAVDGLTRQCIAQESYYSTHKKMYNNSNDPKDDRDYYYFGLIKYGQDDRIAPIYAEPKEPTLSTFIGVAAMLSQDKFSCLICRASVHHSVAFSKDFPVVNGSSVDCPEGYHLFKRVKF